MRIGILTQPLRYNYGGILQNYALQQVLTQMGHTPVTLDPKRYRFNRLLYPFFISKHILSALIHRKPVDLFFEIRENHTIRAKGRNTFAFIDKHIKRRSTKNSTDIKPTDYDVLLVGSDQVWRPRYNRDRLGDMFLAFAKGWSIKRYAYAASFGCDTWEMSDVQTAEYCELLSLFDAISVRESSGQVLCKKFFKRQAEHVLDPTMLLSKNDYNALIPKDNENNEEYIATYILDKSINTEKFISDISSEFNLSIHTLCSDIDNTKLPLNQRIPAPIEFWLKGLRDAKLVITDSFHGSVFCILFNTPFLVLTNDIRGNARLSSLLHDFKLEHLLVTENSNSNMHLPTINWKSVNETVNDLRNKSRLFLKYIS